MASTVSARIGAEAARFYSRRLSASFAACAPSAAAYGQCVNQHFDQVKRSACEKEFQAFSTCYRAQLASMRGKQRL